jgi:anti-sigma B factor antagonist
MSLSIREREKEGVTILDLDGRLTAGESIASLREQIIGGIDRGSSRFVLNMAGVDYVDSSGLGMMVVCYTTLKRAGGVLRLLNLTSRNLELLVVTKLTTIFEVFTDEQDAVNSFFPTRTIKKFDVLRFVEEMRQKEASEG